LPSLCLCYSSLAEIDYCNLDCVAFSSAKKNVDCAACEVTRTPADFIIGSTEIASSAESKHDAYTAATRFAALSLAPAPPPVSLSVPHHTKLQHEVYLGLGSNIGNRPANVEMALAALVKDCSCVMLHTSLMYETPAAYVTDQPAFLNCAVKVSVRCMPP